MAPGHSGKTVEVTIPDQRFWEAWGAFQERVEGIVKRLEDGSGKFDGLGKEMSELTARITKLEVSVSALAKVGARRPFGSLERAVKRAGAQLATAGALAILVYGVKKLFGFDLTAFLHD